MPWHGKMADDIAIIRSMVTEQINHDPAHTFMNTGTAISGRPSMGSWINYGLGSDTEDFSGFCGSDQYRRTQPSAYSRRASGRLGFSRAAIRESSSIHQVIQFITLATLPEFRPSSRPLWLRRSASWIASETASVHNPEIDTRIGAYEMAFRMQSSVPGLMDISRGTTISARSLRCQAW